MGFFDKIGDSVTEAGNTISQKAKELSEQSRLTAEIQKKKEEKDSLLKQLGGEVYEAGLAGRKPQIEELMHDLQTVDGFINNYTDALSSIKGMIVCAACGMEIPSDSQFCPGCGTKVEARTVFACPKCGRELGIGAKFCVQCGTKVS